MRILEDRASAMGRSIRTLRERRNLTQKELAELSGLSESSLRSYELGARYPKIEWFWMSFKLQDGEITEEEYQDWKDTYTFD